MRESLKSPKSISLERLFSPRGVAVIGASGDRSRIGGHPIHASLKAEFRGRIFPVNPKYEEIQGLRCYPNVEAIDAPCDLAIVAVRAEAVPTAIAECGRAGIPYAVVLAAGFREIGANGEGYEEELLRAARAHGVRVIGPNCQGMVSVPVGLYAAFGSVADELGLRPGPVSAAFQSGGFGYSIVNLAEAAGIGFRHCVSTGNETDITTPELLGALLDDPETALVFSYIEGVSDGRALMNAGYKSLDTGKPLLIWKGAKTDTGARAAASHTANLTGSYDIYRTAFRTSGMLEVTDVEQIIDLSRVFLAKRLPQGSGVGVLGISGGSGIVFADEAIRLGLELPDFSDETFAALKRVVPVFGSVKNPADITAGVFNDVSLLTETVRIVLADEGVDQLALLLASISGDHATRAAEAIVAAARTTEKPVLIAWSGRRSRSEDAYAIFEEAHIPIIPTPVRLAQAAASMARFAEARRCRQSACEHQPKGVPASKVPILPEGAALMSEARSKEILRAFDIPVTPEVFVPAGEDVVRAAAHIGFPVAVKIVSQEVPHKSDCGGVRLNIADADSLKAATAEVIANTRSTFPEAVIEGVLVSRMARGVETIIGVVNDATFGPVVTLGLGGVFAELLKDVSYRIAPVSLEAARAMISTLRASPLFDGYRAQGPLDKEALAQTIEKVSRMAMALESRLVELDINPVFVGLAGSGVVAADALIAVR